MGGTSVAHNMRVEATDPVVNRDGELIGEAHSVEISKEKVLEDAKNGLGVELQTFNTFVKIIDGKKCRLISDVLAIIEDKQENGQVIYRSISREKILEYYSPEEIRQASRSIKAKMEESR